MEPVVPVNVAVGVEAALRDGTVFPHTLHHAAHKHIVVDDLDDHREPKLFTHDFSLKDRIALVTGGYGGLGLETALAFVEAGARAVYCVGRAQEPPDNWIKVRDYASKMVGKAGEGRLEYLSADASNQVGEAHCSLTMIC